MNNDLYFIPVLARALDQSDPDDALRQAFVRIKTLGVFATLRKVESV